MTKSVLAAVAAIAFTTLSALPASAMIIITHVPDNPRHPENATSYSCDSQFGTLPRVYPAEVAGVGDHHRVWVTELCPSFEGLRNEGNAAYLRPTIANNDVLVDVLRSKSYSADDVYAVRMMGDDTINLYVHHFN